MNDSVVRYYGYASLKEYPPNLFHSRCFVAHTTHIRTPSGQCFCDILITVQVPHMVHLEVTFSSPLNSRCYIIHTPFWPQFIITMMALHNNNHLSSNSSYLFMLGGVYPHPTPGYRKYPHHTTPWETGNSLLISSYRKNKNSKWY